MKPIIVLLVDDQRFVGAALGRLLATEQDIELHCCYEAVEAVAEANKVAPTLILQDLVMPGIDGLTLVGKFRSNRITADTPVIVLSGNDDADSRTRALAAGANDYLLKLPAKAELLACIRRHAAQPGEKGAVPLFPGLPGQPPPRVEATLDRDVMAIFWQAGAPDFTLTLIDQFMREAESRVGALRDAARRLDRAALASTAHSLKGSSSIMGAMRLAALCAQVEDHLARHPEGAVTPALMAAVDQELVDVRDAFAAERQSNTGSAIARP
jgi:CheY-like chemotaxis protein/HPt (histidine-containing phosphotransfer) domain-containing protein